MNIKVSGSLLTQDDFKTVHRFKGDKYYRYLYIPAGHLIIGKRHRYSTINRLVKGRMRVGDYDSREFRDVSKGFKHISSGYAKKVGYAYEDSIWLNIHTVGKDRDVGKLEDFLIIKEEDYDKLLLKELKCLGWQ